MGDGCNVNNLHCSLPKKHNLRTFNLQLLPYFVVTFLIMLPLVSSAEMKRSWNRQLTPLERAKSLTAAYKGKIFKEKLGQVLTPVAF